MSRPFTGAAGVAPDVVAYLRAAFSFPEPEPVDYPFVPSDVAQLHRLTAPAGEVALDDPTWSGLLLDPYLDELSREMSICGRQELYRRLRGGLAGGERAAQRDRVGALLAAPERLEQLHRSLRPLRAADTEVASLLLEEQAPPVPRWAGRTWPLSFGLLASIAAVALSPLAWLGVAAAMYLLIVVQMRHYERIEAWNRKVRTLQLLLRVCSLLGADEALAARGFAQGRAPAGRISRALERSVLAAAIPGAKEYADWFWLANVNHYFKTIGRVFAERDFLLACYWRCAVLEADVALARHLLSVPSWCWATPAASSGALALEAAVHPLLDGAAPLSIALEGKGAFISGQNGVGKSTFLRTLGLSLVTARAFGFCYARHARVPAVPVYASMQSEDSLLGGESLYIAELRRARELLHTAQSGHEAVYLIDEIFRGTNHLESVSAAAAVLDTLAAHSLVLVSSHNLILASLLQHRLDPYCIAREGTALALRAGVLLDTNGVALLGAQGFPPEVAQKAARVAHWLGGYLAEPSAAAGVLRAPASAAPA
jgi:hypothetical protein